MSLQTYLATSDEGPSSWPIVLVWDDGRPVRVDPPDTFPPGSTVTHGQDGGFGTVIASSWCQVTVLWSMDPAPYAPYQPLTVIPLVGFSRTST